MKKYNLKDFSPCKVCANRECGLVDGNECEKCIEFLSLIDEFESMKIELLITRRFIHNYNLEWDLLSYVKNNKFKLG